MKRTLTIACMLCLSWPAAAQRFERSLRTGNEAYRAGRYEEAAAAYREASAERPGDATAGYNLGNAAFRSGDAAAAIEAYDRVTRSSDDGALKAAAWYNRGVVLTGLGRHEEAVEAYRQALRLDPADRQARENLARALREEARRRRSESERRKDPDRKEDGPDAREMQEMLQAIREQERRLRQKIQSRRPDQPSRQEKDW